MRTEMKAEKYANIKPEIEQLVNDGIDIERKLLAQLRELENNGKNCDCEEPECFPIISCGDEHYGDSLIIVEYCLLCGGEKEQ